MIFKKFISKILERKLDQKKAEVIKMRWELENAKKRLEVAKRGE